MVGRGLHANLVALAQRIPPVPDRIEAGALLAELLRRRGQRRAHVLVAGPVPLEDLQQRLDLGIVVEPIRALCGAGTVRHGDAVVFVQVGIQLLGALFAALFGLRDRQRPRAALAEDDVAVSVRVGQRPLVAEHRHEPSRHVEQVRQLFVLPPGELLVVAELVVGRHDVVKADRV